MFHHEIQSQDALSFPLPWIGAVAPVTVLNELSTGSTDRVFLNLSRMSGRIMETLLPVSIVI